MVYCSVVIKGRGDLAAALAMLAEAERRYIRSPLPDFCPRSAMKARIWAAQGKLTKALEWAREQGLSPDDDLSYLHEFEHITLARILIARDQDDRLTDLISAALRLLDRLLHAAEESRRAGSVIEISIVQALAYQAQGNTSAALATLDRALTLAEPEGDVRIFMAEGESMRGLLDKQAHGGGTTRSDMPLNFWLLLRHRRRSCHQPSASHHLH